jgi:pyruvate dehydrogenase E2 component (dihydrolipoamide acetyltransferase)
MPSLGADMEAGTLVEWRVRPGQAVSRGEVVAVVETDKGAIDVEIWEDGVVEEIRVEPGSRVPVGTVLALVRAKGEAAGPTPAAPSPARAPAPGPVPAAAAPSAAPAAPSPAAPPAAGRVRASPAARARARELGVDLAGLAGTGPGGAISVADVEAAGTRAAAPAKAAAPAAAPAAARAGGMRQAIAAAMGRSKREIPHYYLCAQVDLARALSWLAAENARRPVTERLLPAVLFLRAVARAIRVVPEVNGFYVDGAFRQSEAVHLGVAISLRQGGLIAPAIHDVDRKDLGTLQRELNDLVARARGGGLRSSELSDATLTVTSLGDLGVAEVFGVIYPPQVALVGIGRVAERPWVVEGRLEVRPVVTVSLSGDHRVTDGVRGAQFLNAVEKQLAAPEQP